jgi:hypothetical protein
VPAAVAKEEMVTQLAANKPITHQSGSHFAPCAGRRQPGWCWDRSPVDDRSALGLALDKLSECRGHDGRGRRCSPLPTAPMPSP